MPVTRQTSHAMERRGSEGSWDESEEGARRRRGVQDEGEEAAREEYFAGKQANISPRPTPVPASKAASSIAGDMGPGVEERWLEVEGLLV